MGVRLLPRLQIAIRQWQRYPGRWTGSRRPDATRLVKVQTDAYDGDHERRSAGQRDPECVLVTRKFLHACHLWRRWGVARS